jgi:hypothetical protein
MKILLLDDNNEDLQALVEKFRGGPHEITAEAIATGWAKRIRDGEPFEFDAVVADLFMPERPGGPPKIEHGGIALIRAIEDRVRDRDPGLMRGRCVVLVTALPAQATGELKEILSHQDRLPLPERWVIPHYKVEDALDRRRHWSGAVAKAVRRIDDMELRRTSLAAALRSLDVPQSGVYPRLWQSLLQLIQNSANVCPAFLLQGPGGSGKTFLADSVHSELITSGKFVKVDLRVTPPEEWLSQWEWALGFAGRGLIYFPAFLSRLSAVQHEAMQHRIFDYLAPGTWRPDSPLICLSVVEADWGARLMPELASRLERQALAIPGLAEHPADIRPLAEAILESWPEGKRPEFTDEAWAVLTGYGWPGNVQDLINILTDFVGERAISAGEVKAALPGSPQRPPHAVSNIQEMLYEFAREFDDLEQRNRGLREWYRDAGLDPTIRMEAASRLQTEASMVLRRLQDAQALLDTGIPQGRIPASLFDHAQRLLQEFAKHKKVQR